LPEEKLRDGGVKNKDSTETMLHVLDGRIRTVGQLRRISTEPDVENREKMAQ
jgi:hypothetical protein